MNISVLGCGRWASFIAWYLTKTGHDTVIWGRPSSKNFIRLSETRANDYLTLDDRTCLNSDLGEAVAHAELIVISIESQQLRDLAQRLKDYPIADKTIILCMKGIEEATCMRLTEVIADVLGPDQKTAVWSGRGTSRNSSKGIRAAW
jgi:glycerol-3-phosphate dehydrogenase (NAD(P)+)